MSRGGSKGFTLVELLVVLVVVATLVGLAAPLAINGIERAKEAALKENLHVMRQAIDGYYADHGHYPESLDELVRARYLRKVPADPYMGEADGWREVRNDSDGDRGVRDIRSGAPGAGRDGLRYADW